MTDFPIACTLLDSEQRQCRIQMLQRVYSRVVETRQLENGYAFRFAAKDADLADVMQLIRLERECCAFLRFQLTIEPGGGPIWLELSGPAGTKLFLESALSEGQDTSDQDV